MLLRPRTPGCQRPSRTCAAMAQAGSGDGQQSQRVVICGGGIIGVSTAYFLAQRGVAATVVEREAVAAAASGKAGGFLALDWNDGSPVGPLARRSYELHRQLAEQFGAEAIGYREVDTLQVVGQASPRRAQVRGKSAPLPGWLDGNISACSRLGSKSTTAQVHPAKLCHALMAAAQERGAQLLLGTVCGISTAADGAVSGVAVRQHGEPEPLQLQTDAVVLAMGPWTGDARKWLASAPETSGQKYHSVVLRPRQPVSDTAVFTGFTTADGRSIEPELYPRPDGTVYVCGEPQALPLPPDGPAGVTVDAQRCQVLQGVAGSLASGLRDAQVEAQQACYLPLCGSGLPVIGRLPGTQGAFVATGHSCWGILNGPATGEALAELITTGAASAVNVAPFDPARLAGARR